MPGGWLRNARSIASKLPTAGSIGVAGQRAHRLRAEDYEAELDCVVEPRDDAVLAEQRVAERAPAAARGCSRSASPRGCRWRDSPWSCCTSRPRTRITRGMIRLVRWKPSGQALLEPEPLPPLPLPLPVPARVLPLALPNGFEPLSDRSAVGVVVRAARSCRYSDCDQTCSQRVPHHCHPPPRPMFA